MAVTKIITSQGAEYEIDENALDDYELFEALCEMDKGNMTSLPSVFEALLGADGKKALVRKLKERDGKASVTAMVAELAEIMDALKSKKK